MDRNTISSFGTAPRVDISRSKFPVDHNIKFSGNTGDLIPFDVFEVLPGDTWHVTTNKVLRFQTMLRPIMDNIYLDVYWFFAPSRILWDHWKEFMGENSSSAWLPQVSYSVPQLEAPTSEDPIHNGFGVGSIADYLGVPPTVGRLNVNALPFRMYAITANEWFRDQNLTAPINVYTGDATQNGINVNSLNSYVDAAARGGKPFKAAKLADVFTKALPSPQKGADVLIPGGYVNLQAPLICDNTFQGNDNSKGAMKFIAQNDSAGNYFSMARPGNNGEAFTRAAANNSAVLVKPGNLGIDTTSLVQLSGDFQNEVILGTINELRMAFQIQKLLEADARGGTRYREILRQHFDVISPDATQQIPEYLGGNRIPVVVHQIANTGETESAALGNVGAMSVTTDSHEDFTKSFTEHGYIMGFAVVRYKHTYGQGMNRMWRKKDRFDFYWPELANIGEQAIKTSELYLQPGEGGPSETDLNRVFGYQEPWYEYRHLPDRVCSEMRPGISNTLDSWHLSDYYTETPTLSDSWIREDPSMVDRVLSVSSSVSNQFWADFFVQAEATRPMPVYSIPGLADHH